MRPLLTKRVANQPKESPRKRLARVAVALAFGVAATGCVAGPETTSDPAVPLQPVTAGPYEPQSMTRSDGGPMLWPLLEEDGSGDPGLGTESLTHIAFLDSGGRVVTPAIYRDFDFCVSDDRPIRVAAVRDGGIDIITLDGRVASTIATTAFNVPDGWADQVRCEDNKTVVALAYHPDDTSVDVWFDRRDTFDLLSGERVSSDRTPSQDTCSPGDPQQPVALPADYKNDIGGGWAMNETATAAINLSTKTVVELVDTDTTFCIGAGGFLNCSGGVLPLVHNAGGELTSFSSVDVPSLPAGCGELDVPYLWATAGTIQGYIDADGKWLYQEPRYTYLSD